MQRDLSKLPEDHPLRTEQLSLVGAEYRFNGTETHRRVLPGYGIGRKCFNDLSPIWTDCATWFVESKGEAE